MAYTNGRSVVFEVFVKFDFDFFNSLVYYPDLKNPVPHWYPKFGVGAHFKEFAIDPSWSPEKMFKDYKSAF